MSPEIELEMYFLFHSFLMGILITVLYDILRILRRILPHNILAVSVEDFLYWIVCSLLVFVMLIRENNGILRWFAVAGAMIGMMLYKKTLGRLFVRYFSLFLQKILHIVGKWLRIIAMPLQLVTRRLAWMRKKSENRMKRKVFGAKKKLTERRKLLRMVLYKK